MKTGHAVARVTFNANREMVAKALSEGWSAKAIYDQNQPKLDGISYRQFVRYVNEMRTPRPATPAPVPAHETTEGQTRRVRKTFDDHEGTADPALVRKLTSG